MIWAVIDTTIWVSGFGWGGAPGEVVDRFVRGEFLAVTSPALLEELSEVLRREKFADVFPDPDRLMALVQTSTALVSPETKLAVFADEADNRLLEAAAEADADFVVTGDKAVLDFGALDQTRMTTPRRFVEILDEGLDGR